MPGDLSVRALTAEAFVPYGTVITQPATPAEATGPGWAWWAEAGLLPRQPQPYAIGYLDLRPVPLLIDWAERHMQSVEAIIPLNGPCLIHVARDPTAIEVFRIEPGQAVVLSPGTWHGAPLAIDRPLNALVLLAQSTGTNDTEKRTFPAIPISP